MSTSIKTDRKNNDLRSEIDFKLQLYGKKQHAFTCVKCKGVHYTTGGDVLEVTGGWCIRCLGLASESEKRRLGNEIGGPITKKYVDALSLEVYSVKNKNRPKWKQKLLVERWVCTSCLCGRMAKDHVSGIAKPAPKICTLCGNTAFVHKEAGEI